MNNETARIYDLKTQTVTTIPAAELAPGMVRVQLEELGEVWVRAEDIQRSEPRHEFDDSIIPYIEELKSLLDDVYPQSLEDWIEGFSRDQNPEKEIAIWLHIGAKFQEATQGRELSAEAKWEYFSIFLNCCNSGERDALRTISLEVLSRSEAEAAVRFFFSSDSEAQD